MMEQWFSCQTLKWYWKHILFEDLDSTRKTEVIFHWIYNHLHELNGGCCEYCTRAEMMTTLCTVILKSLSPSYRKTHPQTWMWKGGWGMHCSFPGWGDAWLIHCGTCDCGHTAAGYTTFKSTCKLGPKVVSSLSA